jgi:hypothetical protein
MSNVITITTEGGTTITIPMGSAAVPQQVGSPKVTAPAPKVPSTVQQPKAASPTSSPKVTKPKRRRVARPSAKPIYAEIYALTAEGRHDEAIALAESKGWTHVVDSVNAHRAKQVAAGKASTIVTGKAGSAPAASKKQVRSTASKKPSKASTASKKPFVPKPKASVAKQQPKAATHVADGEAIPTDILTEGDLAQYWGLCIAKGNADIARAALKSSKQSLLSAIKDGSKVEIKVQHTRVKTLEHLLAEAGQKPA